MNAQFELLKTTRKNIVSLLESCTDDQLVKIAPNYNNSIAWNAAHALVTMQLLCYKLSGNEVSLDNEFVDLYRKGSKASENTIVDIEKLKEDLLSSSDQLEKDYNNGLFKNYNTYPTSYGYELNSIEDAITFNNVHDALHFGYMMAQKRAL